MTFQLHLVGHQGNVVEAILSILSDQVSRGYWVGLENPNGGSCDSAADCHDHLKWLDGTNFQDQSFITEIVEADQARDCIQIRVRKKKAET